MPIERKLRIQFVKALKRGHVHNAQLDPAVTRKIAHATEPGEHFIVRIDKRNGGSYWFSDRRVLLDDDSKAQEILRYEFVQTAHWITKDLSKVWTPAYKKSHYDRLEIELTDGLAVLDGLGQAYNAALKFLWWIS